MLLERWDGRPVDDLLRLWDVPLIEAWAVVTSTSDRAAQIAAEGCPVWTVVVADEQTAGRGRQGDRWHSAPGAGLWMTIVAEAYEGALPLPLVTGVACAEAIERRVPSVRISIKWPNDMLIGDRKVGGVLCERRGGRVLIGIGINTTTPEGGFDPTIDPPPITLEMAGGNELSRSELAGAILAALRRHVGPGHDVGATKAMLDERDYLAGRAVSSQEHGPGTARGIDADGALVLERGDGRRVRVGSGKVGLWSVADRR